MTYKENLTSEEIAQQKAARRRFREIVKQRWQEEQLKKLSKKALKKISKKQSPISPLSLGEGKGVRTPAPTLTEAINGLIINKHLNK